MTDQLDPIREITGTMLTIRDTPAEDFDYDAFFRDRMQVIARTPERMAYALILAAQIAGRSIREHKGMTGPVLFNLPDQVADDPHIVSAYRMVIATMNDDVDNANALIRIAVRKRSDAMETLSVLVGLLVANPAGVDA